MSVPKATAKIGFAVVIMSTTGHSTIEFVVSSSPNAAIELVLAQRKKHGIPFIGGSVHAFVVDNAMLDKARTPDAGEGDRALAARRVEHELGGAAGDLLWDMTEEIRAKLCADIVEIVLGTMRAP